MSLRKVLQQWWLRRKLLPEEEAILTVVRQKYGASQKDCLFFVRAIDNKPLLPVTTEAWLEVWGSSGNGPWVNLTNNAGFVKHGISTLDEIGKQLHNI